MTIRTDIVQRAFRMLNKVGIGQDLDPDEASEALKVFQDMLITMPEIGLGGPLTDVLISADYTANEDERITNTSGSPVVISLPSTITETNGTVRPPRNGAIVQINGAASPEIHLYVGYLAGWQRLTDLTLNSANPLGPMHHEGLAALLALRLTGPNTAIPEAVPLQAEKGLQHIANRFRPSMDTPLDLALRRRRRYA